MDAVTTPEISNHFRGRHPSAIRMAQIAFAARPDRDQVQVVNTAIGNVSLPMHPAMQARMGALGQAPSPFADGVLEYTASVGRDETQRAFMNIIASAGGDTRELRCVVTDGGSQAMELMLLGVCGPGAERPLLLLDPAYTNYMDLARRVAVPTVSIRRQLSDDGVFSPPDVAHLDRIISDRGPRGIVIIPADNPTGQFMTQEEIVAVARVCVAHNIWLVSDEAYRQLQYGDEQASTIWRLTAQEVPGIRGRRISIESASKVWNACGLRIGALVTDNAELHAKAVAEYTANLCANAIGQHVFGALADLAHTDLHRWYAEQRAHYAGMMGAVTDGLRRELPGVIVSVPRASLYSVIDVRNIAPPGFDAVEFVRYCATRGRVDLDGRDHTLLVAPMGGFYGARRDPDGSATQMRMAFVEPVAQMQKVPRLFAALLRDYLG